MKGCVILPRAALESDKDLAVLVGWGVSSAGPLPEKIGSRELLFFQPGIF